MKNITTIFLDIGGVLLTNGWGRDARNNAIAHFGLDPEETNERHHLTFDTYEEGKLTLSEYLQRVVFYETREFSEKDFIAFMFEQSQQYRENIEFFKAIKSRHNVKVIAVSNEGRELNAYRIRKFKLKELFDAFISSSYVHLRKPDADIFRMAIDISHVNPVNSVYIDDRHMFVEIAESLGMNGIHFTSLDEAKKQMEKFGLTLENKK